MTDRTDERRTDDSSSGSSEQDTDSLEDPTTERREGSSDGRDPPSKNESGPSIGQRIDDTGSDDPEGIIEWLRWFRAVDSGPMLYIRDLVTSVAIVLFIGACLFAISGVWPPMVAIESGSMEPNMERGDLVLVVDNDRFTPEAAVTDDGRSTGIVPADVAREHDHEEFNRYGDVIVFQPNGNTGRTPVIHRTMFWVEAGENWYDSADPSAVGDADDCSELEHCPAPHAGFVTKGDNERTNRNYDQVTRLSAPVRPEWIIGTAELRVPYLGHVRLLLSVVTAEPVATEPPHEPTADPSVSVSENATSTGRAV